MPDTGSAGMDAHLDARRKLAREWFLSGMLEQEIAQRLSVSLLTVKRDLAHAPPVVASPQPPPEPKTPHPSALGLPHQPRIVSEDSHDVIVESPGKVIYVARKPPEKPLTYAEVCEAAGATMKHRPRF